MVIRMIPPQKSIRKKRVAAYARVSTLMENQEDSFETQVKYYETFIKSNSDWELCKIYSDFGFSGVSAEKRPGFMEMIREAEDKNFDILLVRSVSRFARNVREAQIYCHKLKALGIEVVFEKESISGTDTSTEMAFNLLAACAQEESRIASARIKWANNERAKQGIRHLGNNRVLGYDEIDGKLTPNQDAWIIRKIFADYADGRTMTAIANALNELGVRGIRKHNPLHASYIGHILRNEIYVGDRLLQKSPPKHYLTHKPDRNQPYDSYYHKNMHTGIVSRELWNAVQGKLVVPFVFRSL